MSCKQGVRRARIEPRQYDITSIIGGLWLTTLSYESVSGIVLISSAGGHRAKSGICIMRNFISGAVIGAFGTVWWFGALPDGVEDFLNQQVGVLASKVGITTSGETPETESTSRQDPATPASTSNPTSGSSEGG